MSDKKNLYMDTEPRKWPQVLAISIACMASLTNGLIFSWSSPFMVQITNDKEQYEITEEEASYFAIVPPFGMMFTSIISFNLNDTIGRKWTLILLSVPQVAFWVLTIFAKDVKLFYLARFIAGMGDGAVYSSLPTYIGEISTPQVRGSWGNMVTFTTYLGRFLINVIGSHVNVKQASYICVSVPILFTMLFSFMPESPYYYLMKGKEEEARKSLMWLRRTKHIEEEFSAMTKDVHRQLSESGTWKDLFTIKSNRKALRAGIFLRVSQQFSGVPVFTTYTQLIFEKAGGSLSPQLSSIIFMGLSVIANFVSGIILDKFGRRKAYISSLILCAIALMIEAVYFYIEQFAGELLSDSTIIQLIPIGGMIMWIISYCIGLGLVPTLMLGELFSTKIKSKGLCTLIVVFGLAIFVPNQLFEVLITHVGMFSPFSFFSMCCFTSSVLSLYFLPETKGKTLEEIQQSLKESKKRNKSNENIEKEAAGEETFVNRRVE